MKPWNVNRVIPEVNCKFGAPMGRSNVGKRPATVTSGKRCQFIKKNQPVVYDKKVPMSDCGAYDAGGAYWGIGKQLRVMFTPDLSYIEFYRIP
jgi:hypothetical protein